MTDEKPEEGQRAVIYARVSTDDKGQTVDTQVRICREFCESKGHNIVGVYTDEKTGSKLDRSGFNQMNTRITYDEDVDYVVVYDQSRLTRAGDFDKIKRAFAQHRCYIRLASMDIDLDTLAGNIITANTGIFDKNENKVRNEKTHLGMFNKKLQGYHVGHPAKVMFHEDLPNAPKGLYSEKHTTVVTEEYIYSFARQGLSIPYVAKHILNMSGEGFKGALKPVVWDGTCSPPKARPDRLTVYRSLYEEAKKEEKDPKQGSPQVRVGKTDETPQVRVVL